MNIWIDTQISPFIALWINTHFKAISAKSLRAIGLLNADDIQIFQQAKKENVVIITKHQDFLKLLEQFGPPPKLIWITCGNTSNARMAEILMTHLQHAVDLLEKGENIVEISG